MRGLKRQYTQANNCFKVIDFQGKGFITKDDLLRAFTGIKNPFSKPQIQKMLDEEGDGDKIDYEMFKHKYFVNDEMRDLSDTLMFREGVSEKQVILDRLKLLDL